MAGELLIRVLNWETFQSMSGKGSVTEDAADVAFLDQGQLIDLAGTDYVVLEDSAFFEEAYWLYEDHHLMQELPLSDNETATLVVSRDMLLDWQQKLIEIPKDGLVATEQPEVRDALQIIVRRVLKDPKLRLTVQSIL